MFKNIRHAGPILAPLPSTFRRLVAVVLVCIMGPAASPALAGAPKAIDPEVVRTRVEKLGVGEHVMVQRTEAPKLRGRITVIEATAFKLRPDNSQAEVLIPYHQVLKVKKNPGALTWMALGAILVIVVIIATR